MPKCLGAFGMANRELAAIFFSDVQGFSRLKPIQVDTFVERVIPQIGRVVERYRGHLVEVNTWGDGMFLTSREPVKLAELALELRDLFRGFDWINHQLPELKIRIALHAGQVVLAANTVKAGSPEGHFGTAVNLCARIEPITPANKIFTTKFFADHVADSRFRFDPIGLCRLPKGAGEADLCHLRWQDDQQYTTRPKGAIEVREWIDQADRHEILYKRLTACKPGELVRFVSITGKSVLLPDPVAGVPIKTKPFPAALDRGVNFQGVVLDPDCQEALFRSQIETPGEPPEHRLLQMHARAVAGIRKQYAQAGIPEEKTKQRLKLKYTARGLAFSLWLFEEVALIEPYHLGEREGIENLCEFSQLIIPKSNEISYELMTHHFEKLWNDSEARLVWSD